MEFLRYLYFEFYPACNLDLLYPLYMLVISFLLLDFSFLEQQCESWQLLVATGIEGGKIGWLLGGLPS